MDRLLTSTHQSDAHGINNPNWSKYANNVWYGTGKTKRMIEMVVIISNGETVTGWDASGRFVTVRRVVGVV